jgi:hypothetical protein
MVHEAMAQTPQRWSEIDRELAAFGKTDAELEAVVERARALVRSLDDVDGLLASLGEGREAAVARAREAAREASATARAAAPSPEPIHPASAPPPDYDDAEATDVRPAAAVEAEQGAPPSDGPPARSSDITGLSVDELFADAAPSASPEDGADGGGLADLFDDEPLSLGEGDEDEGFSSLEDQLEGEDTSASTPPPAAARAPAQPSRPPPPPPSQAPPPLESFPPIGREDEAEEESTHVLSAEDFEEMMELGGSDEFELLVDEDVLELDAAEEAPEPPEGDGDEDGGKSGKEGGGLISRLLGRK